MQKNLNQKDQLKTFNSFFRLEEQKLEHLKTYVKLLIDNQKNLNLVSHSTINDIWIRHIADSAQIHKFLIEKKNDKVLDVGSGAGLPGIVLSIMGISNILLCEKSPKKYLFLKKIMEDLNIKEVIYNGKVESLYIDDIKYIISRAFKPLSILLEKTIHLIQSDTILILHKGKNYKNEIVLAKKIFNFSCSYYDSITSKEGKILKIERVKRIND